MSSKSPKGVMQDLSSAQDQNGALKAIGLEAAIGADLTVAHAPLPLTSSLPNLETWTDPDLRRDTNAEDND